MGGECKKCSHLKGAWEGPASLVFLLEHSILLEKLKNLLDTVGINYKEEENIISLKVDSFKTFLKGLEDKNSFSDLELEDIWLVVLSEEESFRPSHIKSARSLKFWLSQLACADYLSLLQREALLVYFHPILDRSFSIVGYECLIRGLSEDGRILPPSYMFKCAEDTDTVFYLDRLCREKAVKSSFEKGLNDCLLFINFVPTSIYNPETCLRTTMEMVNTYRLNPENIVFEVVESHKVDDLNHLKRILDYYREKGFKVALDDVGAGFSGLISLVNLRPDIIKIDKEIVRGINGDSLKQSIVKALTDMCNKNGISTIAEGIETYGELEFLIDKVDYLQGFLFAQPSEEPPKRLRVPS